MSLRKSVWGLYKRNTWDSRSPLSHSASIPTAFHSQKLWGFFFLVLEPCSGGSGMGLETPSLLRICAAKISLPILFHHM